jgi:hypothetical protein
MTTPSRTDSSLRQLFDAERTSRRVRAELAEEPGAAVLDAIEASLKGADGESEDERSLRLATLARVLGELTGPRAVDLLVDILASDDAEAQAVAGEALEDVAFDRFKEVALAVERALVRLPHDSPALSELPYVLVDVPEPGVAKLLARFLDHPSAEAVAAGIEAIVELGDPSLLGKLAKLEKDERPVEMDDTEDEPAVVTIGELAREARELLQSAGGER